MDYVNSRATLSVLAGSIWRSNAESFVIEENCGEKVASETVYRGRHGIGFPAEGRSCYGEAKQVWPVASNIFLWLVAKGAGGTLEWAGVGVGASLGS